MKIELRVLHTALASILRQQLRGVSRTRKEIIFANTTFSLRVCRRIRANFPVRARQDKVLVRTGLISLDITKKAGVMSFFIHEKAICESVSIGDGSKILEFCHVFPGAVIGSDCEISSSVLVENGAVLGDRVTVKSGTQLWGGVELEDDVFVGPNVTFTNDLFPRSGVTPREIERTIVKKGASIGGNATILPGIRIGEHALVGAGSVVSKDVPDFAIVSGNPAQIQGYTRRDGSLKPRKIPLDPDSRTNLSTGVQGVEIIALQNATDIRGSLVAAETGGHIRFPLKRFFFVMDVPSLESRGAHAHRTCHQILIAVTGSLNVIVDDGRVAEEYVLSSPKLGLYMPPMTWGTQHKYSPGSVLFVAASEKYDEGDYIRDYEEFLELTKKAPYL